MSLQGTFKTLGITEVLEFLSSRTASGRLDVTTEMGTASYILSEGAVAGAEYSFIRESGVDAAEATYYVVSELDGSFFFDDEILDHDGVPGADGDPEDVGSVLFRTADIAERWADVEEVIPSPNHMLTRNTQLDGSVTIQPEWWKALEVIGEGSTSLQLASTLELGALDASLTALAMTNAGLLVVTEVDPLNIALSTDLDEPLVHDSTIEESVPEFVIDDGSVPETPESVAEPLAEAVTEATAEVDPEAMIADAVEALDILGQTSDVASPEENPPESALFQPVDMLEVVDVEPPLPTEPIDVPAIPQEHAEPTMSFSTPAPTAEVAPDPQPIEYGHEEETDFVGASGMDDHSELEYMVEPEGSIPVVSGDDDDGWSNAHTAADLQPMAAPAPVAPEVPDIVQAAPPSAIDETSIAAEPSPFDGLPVPEPQPFESAAPVPDVAPAMDLSSLPAPPPPIGEETRSAAPVPDVGGYSQSAPEAESMATSMAGEVLDDLASMTDELNEPIADDENWQLDGTFVPETNPTPTPVDGDPFGDLGELLTDDDERSSVLKFLRRD